MVDSTELMTYTIVATLICFVIALGIAASVNSGGSSTNKNEGPKIVSLRMDAAYLKDRGILEADSTYDGMLPPEAYSNTGGGLRAVSSADLNLGNTRMKVPDTSNVANVRESRWTVLSWYNNNSGTDAGDGSPNRYTKLTLSKDIEETNFRPLFGFEQSGNLVCFTPMYLEFHEPHLGTIVVEIYPTKLKGVTTHEPAEDAPKDILTAQINFEARVYIKEHTGVTRALFKIFDKLNYHVPGSSTNPIVLECEPKATVAHPKQYTLEIPEVVAKPKDKIVQALPTDFQVIVKKREKSENQVIEAWTKYILDTINASAEGMLQEDSRITFTMYLKPIPTKFSKKQFDDYLTTMEDRIAARHVTEQPKTNGAVSNHVHTNITDFQNIIYNQQGKAIETYNYDNIYYDLQEDMDNIITIMENAIKAQLESSPSRSTIFLAYGELKQLEKLRKSVEKEVSDAICTKNPNSPHVVCTVSDLCAVKSDKCYKCFQNKKDSVNGGQMCFTKDTSDSNGVCTACSQVHQME